MTIEQTVTIPANRLVHLDFEVPREIPVGKKARILLFPIADTPKSNAPLLSLRGSCKGLDTMEAYFARKQADKDFEDGLTDVNPYLIKE